MPEPCRSCDRRETTGAAAAARLSRSGDAAATDPACGLSPLHAEIFALAEAESSAGEDQFIYRSYASMEEAGSRST